MGNWNITIIGTGAHHNKDYPDDADKMFNKFVEELREAKHNIEHASFTYGGAIINRPYHKAGDIYNCYSSSESKVVLSTDIPLKVSSKIITGSLDNNPTEYEVISIQHESKTYYVNRSDV